MKIDATPNIIARLSEIWSRTAGLRETRLLRIALLRDLTHELHSEESRILAERGSSAEGLSILRLQQARIEKLISEVDLRQNATIETLLSSLAAESGARPEVTKGCKKIPQDIEDVFGADKLRRSDRTWECTIIAEAVEIGWEIWQLTAEIPIQEVEHWHRDLGQQLFPKGIVLLVEPAQSGSIQHGLLSLWRGKWFLLFPPGTEPVKFRLPHLSDGSPLSDSPQWKRLFPRESH